MKLLIVEDDLLLQEGLALGLANEGYALDCAGTAAEADSLIQSGEYSLVILDLGLPDKDGATLLTQWRRRGIANPVLILQQDIYSWQDDPGSNTLEVHIHNLRRKLGKDRIKTVRGVGYRLESQK